MTALLFACADPGPQVVVVHGEAQGTTYTVKYLAEVADPRVPGEVERVLSEVDLRLSTWRDDSDLARIRAGQGPVAVSEETWMVVAASLQIAEQTNGAFDPTVQPLVELWGIHGERRMAMPSDAEVEAARARVGWQRVLLARDGGMGTVDAGGTALDLAAIAPGHTVDRLANAVSALGHPDLMVELGGEVRAQGHNAEGEPWRIGVDRPEAGHAPGEAVEAVVELTNAALATSGNYRNRYVIDGLEVHHTLDPATGRPAQNDVLSASVVAPDCRTADGLATALMVMGTPGLKLVESLPDVEAMLFVAEADAWKVVETAGMPRVR